MRERERTLHPAFDVARIPSFMAHDAFDLSQRGRVEIEIPIAECDAAHQQQPGKMFLPQSRPRYFSADSQAKARARTRNDKTETD
ncbi:MAG TPA: hypothetical protein VMH84_01870 [Xanthobacteraceae bacterium]|nr:hypothetical protein [Xanthobacteraceae bacterium]